MQRVLFFVCVALPWLNPFAPGPSPSLVPWLLALACIAVLIALCAAKSSVSLTRFVIPIAAGWLVAGLISSVISLLQYFGVATPLNPWVNQTNFGEAFANLRQRNQFATLTNIALCALLWLALKTTKNRIAEQPHITSRVSLMLAASCMLAIGNAISSSRTGLFQVALLCGFYGLWGYTKSADSRRLLLCAAFMYSFAMFAIPWAAGLDWVTHGAFARFGKDEVCASRMTLWSNVLHLIAQKPWFGWGWGELDYAHFITLYSGPRFCDILDNAHNLPLHLAVELGVPVAVLVCGGFIGWAVRQKPWAERDATRQMAWAVMAVILLHSMLEYPLWYGPFQMAFLICIGLLWRPKQLSEARNRPEKVLKRALANVIQAPVAIFIIASVVYAAWDYRRISQIYLPPESRASAYRTDTLNKIRASWLFSDQVQFAELLTTPLTLANAEWTFDTAEQLLHYSPEPRVIEKLIESAVLLGKDDAALGYLARYRAAFSVQHAKWAKGNQGTSDTR